MATWLACDKMHSEAAVSACVDPHVGTCAKREAESQTRALLHRRAPFCAERENTARRLAP